MSLEVGRLSTTDETGKRVYLYRPDYDGKWKRFRKKVYYVLIWIYLILPWIHINGEQIVRLDIEHRVFVIFGVKLMAHNVPLIAYFFLGFAFLIAFVTARWGRIWCGYACPQTVFLDAVYGPIERLIEGNFSKRRELDRSPWSARKIFIKFCKWSAFLLISLHIVHSFLGYFVGTYELLEISTHNPAENWTLFTIMLVLTFIILFDFGWFREQFCIIACPYGRLQSVLMDEKSLIVAYDQKRGEPRRAPEITKDKEGDCIDCNRCVKVCPTGIDIRKGLQLECIACTACIDACDEIMRKVNKPEGLISYSREDQTIKTFFQRFNIRQIIYLLVLTVIFGFFIRSVGHLQDLDVVFTRSGAPYTVNGESVASLYQVKVERTGRETRTVRFKAMNRQSGEEVSIKTPYNPLSLDKELQNIVIFFDNPKSAFKNGKIDILFIIDENVKGEWIQSQKMELTLAGPF